MLGDFDFFSDLMTGLNTRILNKKIGDVAVFLDVI